jgi:hypothetical protein
VLTERRKKNQSCDRKKNRQKSNEKQKKEHQLKMTSTNFTVGLSESRNSSKVLKPPGGGTSDIFGGAIPNTPRSVRNHMASNIFSAGGQEKNGNGESTRRQPPANSHNRLFGEVTRPVATPSKNHFKSNLPFGVDATDSNGKANGNGKLANGNGIAHANGNGHAANGNGIAHTNGNGIEHGDIISNGKGLNGHTNGHKSDGNPVTGEGYKSAPVEINTTVPSLNGARQVINKNRIPPGGFSSGLW